MGFPVSLRIDDEGDFTGAADAVFAWLREADVRFSPFKPDSEVSRYGRGALADGELSADLTEVLGLCADLRGATGGAFDARLPGRGFDPCAVVKGWSVQRAAGLLTAAGARRFCLNAGGDVFVSGGPWRVGIRHPEQADQVCAVLAVTDAAVATSGGYERGEHILDGRTGRPATGLLSLTVVAPTLTEADATATAAFALGADGPAWAAARTGCEVFAIDTARQVLRTRGLPVAQGLP
ncbi:FAD:protein FMN transferase [Streptomyces alanosinicus]|uniref:FAD:protein FMN transferase n=2 Tax=Streptomyces alanosinicus TaxID=68171 RepID=A0A918YFB0_9ACTN|nr:FAD:protein FMN transferase [Streptomyces alanosinicus]